MPYLNGAWRDFWPHRTRQFIFSHMTPLPGLDHTVIPDDEVHRILRSVVRGIGERGCWGYGRQRSEAPRIKFRDAAGELHTILGNRFALLLRDDVPIPPGRQRTTNRDFRAGTYTRVTCTAAPSLRTSWTPTETGAVR